VAIGPPLGFSFFFFFEKPFFFSSFLIYKNIFVLLNKFYGHSLLVREVLTFFSSLKKTLTQLIVCEDINN
jgi:hypothetical protein